MPFDDLDLEFEDEEDSKKKKSDAVQVDVDLEFHASEAQKKALAARSVPSNSAGTVAQISKLQSKIAEVKKTVEGRPNTQPSLKRPVQVPPMSQVHQVQGTSALKEDNVVDLESSQVVQLREQVRRVEFEAEVKVQVAEFKAEILGEMLGDMKLMEHQIGQLLARINAKNPDMKQEILMIKKILADFTAKKRK